MKLGVAILSEIDTPLTLRADSELE